MNAWLGWGWAEITEKPVTEDRVHGLSLVRDSLQIKTQAVLWILNRWLSSAPHPGLHTLPFPLHWAQRSISSAEEIYNICDICNKGLDKLLIAKGVNQQKPENFFDFPSNHITSTNCFEGSRRVYSKIFWKSSSTLTYKFIPGANYEVNKRRENGLFTDEWDSPFYSVLFYRGPATSASSGSLLIM